MRLGDLLRHAVDEVPHVVGELSAVVALRRVLAFALFALADGNIAIRRHDRDGLEVVGVEQRAGVAHCLVKELLIGVAKLVDSLTGPDVALAAVKCEPLGMFGKDFLAIRHRRHAVRDLDAVIVARAEAHGPHRSVVADDAEAEVELPQRKVRSHCLVDLRQRDRFRRWHHLAQFAGQIPPHAEAAQEAAHGVEAAALVETPDFQRLVLRGPGAIWLARVGGQPQPVLVEAGVGHAVGRAENLLPLGPRARDVGVARGPRRGRHEIAVVTDKRHPVRPGGDAIRAELETIRLHRIVRARAHENLHRLSCRLCHDRQPRAADLFDLSAQFMRRNALHARRNVRDDDLGAWLAILDDRDISRGSGLSFVGPGGAATQDRRTDNDLGPAPQADQEVATTLELPVERLGGRVRGGHGLLPRV